MSADPPEILRMEGVGKTYIGIEDAPALTDINLSIHTGEFVAIVGASGAGKSTLLNLIGLLDSPTTGQYVIAGQHLDTLNDRERDRLRAHTFGFVFQDSHMLPKESAASNAALGLKINHVDPARRPQIVASALATVGVIGKANDRAEHLSGGERQRVAIARAIAPSPRILLADEPTGALDSVNAERVVRLLRDLNRTGVTVILITHDAAIAHRADRIIEIRDGRIVDDTASSVVRTDLGAVCAVPRPPAGTQKAGSRARERIIAAISSHTVHAARAALLLVAFTVGAGGLVTAIGLSESAAAQVVGRLDSAALDEFLIVPKNAPATIRAEFALQESDSSTAVALVAMRRALTMDGIREVGMAATTQFDGSVTILDPNTVPEQPQLTPEIHVADSTYLQLMGVHLAGSDAALRLFTPEHTHPMAALGPRLAAELGLDQPSPGAQLWIGTTPVAIAGVIEDLGDLPQLGSALIVNPALANQVSAVDAALLARTDPGFPAQLASTVGLAISPGDPTLYSAETVADLRSLKFGVASDLVSLISIMAWVLLALSSIGAATAAYLSVHARTSEIALRRAVGESQRSIWRQFLLEGVVIGLFGGVLGSAIGVVLIVALAGSLSWTPTFTGAFLGLGVGAGALTGIVASLYPAAVAARQSPARAVKGA